MLEDFNNSRRLFLKVAAMTIAGARLGVVSAAVEQAACASRRLPSEGELSSLDTATAWLNSEPLTATELRGKVVLIDFGTYSCINWMRTLPYIRVWADKYKDQGLVVVCVHTPEFPFEKNVDNVRQAAKGMNINFPLGLDNDYAIWNAFGNNYWPALYFIDAKGRIRHHYFGEGDYQQCERVIQQLLAEAGSRGVGTQLVSVEGRGVEASADWSSLRSQENYVGYARSENFASPGGAAVDEPRAYAAPAQLRLNHWAVSGCWTIASGAILLNAANGRIGYRFHARDLNLVMGPSVRGTSLPFRVLVDGRPPAGAHGIDVDEQGRGNLSEPRLYQLIRQPNPVRDRQFEIEFLESGAQAFAFTFG